MHLSPADLAELRTRAISATERDRGVTVEHVEILSRSGSSVVLVAEHVVDNGGRQQVRLAIYGEDRRSNSGARWRFRARFHPGTLPGLVGAAREVMAREDALRRASEDELADTRRRERAAEDLDVEAAE